MEARVPVLLIVEDELPVLERIVELVQQSGMEAVSTRSVEEAKGMFAELPAIDGVWIDHFLPNGRGIELVEYIRRTLKRPEVKIFLVSNAIEPQIVNEYIRQGIQGYYPKLLSRLEATVRKVRTKMWPAAYGRTTED
jgi:response regulator of citrate/malate metabolism